MQIHYIISFAVPICYIPNPNISKPKTEFTNKIQRLQGIF